MNKKPRVDNHYCTHCRRTTRHEVKPMVHVCSVCGIDKYRQAAQSVAHSLVRHLIQPAQ